MFPAILISSILYAFGTAFVWQTLKTLREKPLAISTIRPEPGDTIVMRVAPNMSMDILAMWIVELAKAYPLCRFIVLENMALDVSKGTMPAKKIEAYQAAVSAN